MKTVALLRSLNLGSHNRISMSDLSDVFVRAGCTDVVTYIQSGNVVFTAPVKKKVNEKVHALLLAEFEIDSPVVLRTQRELISTLKSQPFPKAPRDRVYFGFYDVVPDQKIIDALDPKRSPPDQFKVKGREVFMHCPEGQGRTKLTTAFFEKKTGAVVTFRNWNTVEKLIELSAD